MRWFYIPESTGQHREGLFVELNSQEYLVLNGPKIKSVELKRKLLKVNRLELKCFVCKTLLFWNDLPLMLELDHINGNHDDNRFENLRLICPNCHSQTSTSNRGHLRLAKQLERIKKFGLSNKIEKCPNCPDNMIQGAKYCSKCSNKLRARSYKIDWPIKEVLEKEVWKEPLVSIAKRLGVSDVSVKKRCLALGITLPPHGFWLLK